MEPESNEKKHTDKKDKEPEENEYPEGGTDGIIMRDGAPEAKEYPLPDPSAITFTDPMDTARVELKTLREPPGVALRSMNDVAVLVRGMEDYDRERMKVIHLDTKNRVLHVENISTGTINMSIVHPREAVKGAVLSSATSVIIVHNHPSGVPEPSPEDKTVAQALVNAFHLMRIDVLDFVIVAKDWQYSYKDYGELPRPQDPVIEVLDHTLAEGGSEECKLALKAAREVLQEQCG
jgi:DNA repair protein RadC